MTTVVPILCMILPLKALFSNMLTTINWNVLLSLHMNPKLALSASFLFDLRFQNASAYFN